MQTVMRDNERGQSRHPSSRALVSNGYVDRDGFYNEGEHEHWSSRDRDEHADNRSTLHFEHLLVRLQALLGPGLHHDDLADELVSVCVDHIKGSKERRALLQKWIPYYPEYIDVSDKEFAKWLRDYLLTETGHSIESKMRQFKDIIDEEDTSTYI